LSAISAPAQPLALVGESDEFQHLFGARDGPLRRGWCSNAPVVVASRTVMSANVCTDLIGAADARRA